MNALPICAVCGFYFVYCLTFVVLLPYCFTLFGVYAVAVSAGITILAVGLFAAIYSVLTCVDQQPKEVIPFYCNTRV